MPEATTSHGFRGAAPVAPAQIAALRLAELRGMRRHGSAFLLGALAMAALPPVDLTPVLVISFTGLVWLADGAQRPREAFAIGWSFGFGFFVAGLYWIAAALFVDIAQFWWLVPFAVLGLPAALAFFTGFALLAANLVYRRWRARSAARVLTLAVCWCAAEWLRGHILTGFPWNLVGYAWSGAFPGSLAMLQTTSLVGIYGLSLVTVLMAMLPATLGDFGGRRWPPLAAAVVLLCACLGFGWARLEQGPAGDVPGVALRIVQPSIPQSLKNDRAEREANFRRHLALSAAPDESGKTLTAIIWPEAGAPPFLDRFPEERALIASVLPPGALAIVGSDRTDPAPTRPERYWNSLVVLDHEGAVVASFDKAHLVPFGEYVPLRSILPMNKITPGTVDFSAGPGPRTLHLPGLPPVSPLICYEAIFPGAVIDPSDRPQWLLSLTNDGWYGTSSGPFQDFSIARTRAVEEGLPLVRAANNGVSGVVDPYGRVVRRLGLDAVGYLDVALPRSLDPTLYESVGDLPFLTALPLLLGLAWCVAHFRMKRSEGA
ncbi:MAG TPA: apolipoprotein N-acyltransferase [Stellaceae bacterium]|nr:apolipoprotein N-acyltransferase [Stellaceae bacterium]